MHTGMNPYDLLQKYGHHHQYALILVIANAKVEKIIYTCYKIVKLTSILC